jgi:hypothetical protein
MVVPVVVVWVWVESVELLESVASDISQPLGGWLLLLYT